MFHIFSLVVSKLDQEEGGGFPASLTSMSPIRSSQLKTTLRTKGLMQDYIEFLQMYMFSVFIIHSNDRKSTSGQV